MKYDLNRFVNLSILLAAQVDSEKLFEVILQEAMIIGNCDGGTIYSLEKDNRLHFRHMVTKSKGISMNPKTGASNVEPIIMNKSYTCAYAAMERQRLNIDDIATSDEFDFSGAKKYDYNNDYRTKSMLVIPMVVEHGDVMGVLQLINAKDDNGNIVSFTAQQEKLAMALGAISALYIENRKLKGLME